MQVLMHRLTSRVIGVGVCAFATLLAPSSMGSSDTVASDSFTKALQGRLNYIFKNDKLDKSSLGVQVFSLSRQETIYSLNSKALLLPASAVKLLTGIVALKKLGPDFTYDTNVYFEKNLKSGVLDGDIYLEGGGDPSLVSERMFVLASDVARTSLKEVKGNILVDDWAFDQERYSEDRLKTTTDRPYNAPIGALSFNYNTTTVYFRPGEKVGDPVRVFVEPDTGYIKVKNSAKTTATGNKFSVTARRIDGGPSNDVVEVSGSMPYGWSEQRQYFNVLSPAIYSGYALKYMLEQKGIKFSGATKIQKKKRPLSAIKVASQGSLPLREIVSLMNKYSNNFIAEALIKTLGKEIKGKPGTQDKGIKVLNEEILRMDIGTTGMNIVSGSGLTRKNKMSAKQFIDVLNAAYLDFEILPELLASLPIAGRDGTLSRRMKGTKAFGRLRAKTGSLDGVSALVGIVQSQGGELLAFSVLMNDSSKSSRELMRWQNYFGQALAEFNRKTVMTEKPTETKAVLEPGER